MLDHKRIFYYFYHLLHHYKSVFGYTLAQWQPYAGFDAHSHKSPKAVTTVNDLRFEYHHNALHPERKTITLDGYYIDVKTHPIMVQ